MRITMVKKRLASGEPCRKCLQAEELLRKRGLWDRIDEVAWAIEDEPDSEGMRLARIHGVEVAPFFIVRREDGEDKVVTSALKLVKEHLAQAATSGQPFDLRTARASLSGAEPLEVVRFALESFGRDCAIAFSGSDDVAVIDLAVQTGLPFSVVTVDTGRLHPETYELIERVRKHYDLDIEVTVPDAERLQSFVSNKGLFSFYEDGHQECCAIRKVEPLARTLRSYRAWMTGQRRDQNQSTRADLELVELDGTFMGKETELVKFNPLARWSAARVWQYIRDYDVPHNALHLHGYASIGCAPCTRAILPGQHEREGRWWWEESAVKECGLHSANLRRRGDVEQ